MATPARTVKCPRCGFTNPAGVSACRSCGLARSANRSLSPVTLSPTHSSSPTIHSRTRYSHSGRATLSSWFGWNTLNGVVVHMDPPYLARPERNLVKTLGTIGLLIVLFPLLLILALLGFLFSTILSIVGLSRTRSGFFSSLASQTAGFFLTGKLFGPKADVPVRDVRVRDSAANEHLVRIRGDFVTGNINVGDDVTVEGFNKAGTLLFRRGYNHRTNSGIQVKYR